MQAVTAAAEGIPHTTGCTMSNPDPRFSNGDRTSPAGVQPSSRTSWFPGQSVLFDGSSLAGMRAGPVGGASFSIRLERGVVPLVVLARWTVRVPPASYGEGRAHQNDERNVAAEQGATGTEIKPDHGGHDRVNPRRQPDQPARAQVVREDATSLSLAASQPPVRVQPAGRARSHGSQPLDQRRHHLAPRLRRLWETIQQQDSLPAESRAPARGFADPSPPRRSRPGHPRPGRPALRLDHAGMRTFISEMPWMKLE